MIPNSRDSAGAFFGEVPEAEHPGASCRLVREKIFAWLDALPASLDSELLPASPRRASAAELARDLQFALAEALPNPAPHAMSALPWTAGETVYQAGGLLKHSKNQCISHFLPRCFRVLRKG